jgi:hypothetical protein
VLDLRRPLNRVTASIAVAVLVLSLVLSGSGGAAAQTPDPSKYGPASPEEIRALEEAAQNVGAPDNPVFPGGYPASMPEAPEVAAAGAVDAWSANWAVGPLCAGAQTCLVGDYNGDGRDDVAVVYGHTVAPSDPSYGNIWVALSTGNGFKPVTKWTSQFCTGATSVCMAGDFNNDGRDDIVMFNKGEPGQGGAGQVYVALSNGAAFPGASLWQPYFCIQQQLCQVGNFDGVNGDDIALFRRSTEAEPGKGDVNVARSNGINGFGGSELWHTYFCIDDEQCRTADMNGDRRDDIIALVKSGSGAGRVPVALSTGGSFGSASDWATGWCYGTDQCVTGDFDGNGTDDLVKFIVSGDVYVRLSTGGGLGDAQRWHGAFCGPYDECAAGDFNGDGRSDIIRFVKQSADPSLIGAAYVAFAGGSAYGFVQTPPPSGKWLEGFCRGGETCTTGDFNGDGLTDIVYFVRNTQTGTAVGDVYVSLNQNGVQFGVPMLWQDYACLGSDICKTGDVNKDGRDDLIVFSRVANGYVYVNLSTGSSFDAGAIWNTLFCIGAEVCDVGDFNGDGLTDIALFTRSTYGNNARAGDVEVAISTGHQFVNTGIWHNFFCLGSENCETGDFNGDGKDDIVTFTKGSSAKVYVALSTGTQFGTGNAPSDLWQNFFCAGYEVCATADVNGDGKVDVLSFLQAGYSSNPSTAGDVYVGLSNGSAAAGGFTSQKWNDAFCGPGEICGTGYFNRDNRADIIAFARGTTGPVYVAISNSGSGYFFSDAIRIPEDAKRIYLPLSLK